MLAILPLILALPLLGAAAPSRLPRSDLAPAKRATLPAGWSYSACMQDGSSRLLQGYQSSTGTNTVESCIAACSSNGYSIAGLENGNECYCSNSYSGTKTTLSASSCTTKCTGSSDSCGGNWALSVYTYTAPAPPSGTTSLGCFVDSPTRLLSSYSYNSPTMTTSSCIATCQGKGFAYAGVEYGVECYCGSSLDTSRNVAPSGDCNMACGGGGTGCGGSYRLSAYKIGTSQKTISGWSYQYCASDGNARALTSYFLSSGSTTLESCLGACASGGFTYGGVENGNECYCGNTLSNGKGTQIAESTCSSTCAGDSTEKSCGGSWAISLYKSTKAATGTSTTSTPAPTATVPSGWTNKGCYADQNARTLPNKLSTGSAMTPAVCIAGAVSAGYAFAGVEKGNECWMGNAINGATAGSGECSTVCAGDSSQKCGGGWRLQIYANPSASTVTTTPQAAPTQPAATTTNDGSYPTQRVPGSGSQKYVWAHHLIGNTYPYDQNAWVADIQLAQSNGIDGFALNIGTDSWQPDRVAKAYAAASQLGNSFKMFLSFDMTAMECGSGNNLGLLQNYVNTFVNHPAAARYNGKTILSTFAGQDCSFSQGGTNNGWNAVMGGNRGNIYFMPTYTSAPTSLNQYSIDGEVNWGSAWPTGGSDIETSRDQYFMGILGSKGYIGTVSPLFFSHFGYKNFMWRGDDWLYAMRWEQIISMRSQIDQIEIASWNDYGESTYVGPIKGDMPSEAKVWATSNFPHSDILSLQAFYSTAWKTGQYPKITKDQVWVMARPHRASASATSDGLGSPTGNSFSQDNFYAQVHLTAAAQVVLSTNSGSQSFSGQAGINRFSYPLSVGSNIRVQVIRNGQTTVDLSPNGFSFVDRPAQYNFNYLIKSSS